MCIVSPSNTVCVTMIPCKILIGTLFMFTSIHCLKKMPIYFGNNCQFLSKFHKNIVNVKNIGKIVIRSFHKVV